MAVRAPLSAAPRVSTADHDDVTFSRVESRAERWANWVVIYLAALLTSLTVGAGVWALGLAG